MLKSSVPEGDAECNCLLKQCPQPDCNNAIKVLHIEPCPVTCNCGHTFCFQLIKNWHDPVKCHFLKKLQKKCDDSETSNWNAKVYCGMLSQKDHKDFEKQHYALFLKGLKVSLATMALGIILSIAHSKKLIPEKVHPLCVRISQGLTAYNIYVVYDVINSMVASFKRILTRSFSEQCLNKATDEDIDGNLTEGEGCPQTYW